MGNSIVAKLLPQRLRHRLAQAGERLSSPLEFAQDSRRYLRNCAPPDSLADDALRGRHLECQLTKDYHRVEKGLALQTPKSPFGADLNKRLEMLIPVGASSADNEPYLMYAHDARLALAQWNAGGGVVDDISPLASSLHHTDWTAAEVGSFLTSRHSVRHFDQDRRPDAALLERAVELAIHTPSVCNRQAWRVRMFGGDRAQEVLRYQNGNTGFREQVPWVAVVTVDSRLFAGAAERNQPWIDGGLFAMSLVYALHGLGVQSCMLNLSVRNKRASQVRRAIGADDAEQLVMMIAIGYAAPQHRVARSPRRDVGEVLQFVD